MSRPFLSNPIANDRALGGVAMERSLRFHDSDNTRITRTIGSTSNRRTYTLSWWLKRTLKSSEQYLWYMGDSSGTPYIDARFEQNTHELQIQDYLGGSNRPIRFITNRKFRDASDWYHFVFAVDTTQGTESNRVKLYVNGVQETSFSTSTYPSQNYDSSANVSGHIQVWGTNKAGTSNDLDGYLAEINFIDGLQLSPTSFGYTESETGIWRPKKYIGNYGTNGYRLDFSDNSAATAVTLGKDRSGNGNDFTPSNFSVSAGTGNDSVLDTPTNNFCTLNPLDQVNTTTSNGNLQVTQASDPARLRGTISMRPNTGKWYYEMTVGSGASYMFGMLDIAEKVDSVNGRVGYYGYNGNKLIDSSNQASSYGASYSAGDTVAILYDSDNHTVNFYKNNVDQGQITGVSDTKEFVPWVYLDNYGTTPVVHINFGQRAFAYTPPTGAKTLCSNNMLDNNVPSVYKAQRHFDVLTYTGTGSQRAVSGLNFVPDWVWVKRRNGGNFHILANTISGAGKYLVSNNNDGESTGGSQLINGFNSDGFDVGTEGAVNASGQSYVAWCWRAGGAAVSNSDGTITSSISANQEGGFSIVTWSGSGSAGTLGHGLGRTPKLIIVKRRTGGSQDWFVNNGMIFNDYGKYFKLNASSSSNASDTNVFPNTAPTSTVFSVGADAGVNASGSTYLALVWSEIPGFSKFGSYVGNGDADGAFVFTGFKPRFIIYRKKTDENWHMLDTKRQPLNPNAAVIDPNRDAAETTDTNAQMDILSNGFKLRAGHGTSNASGTNYFYYAWADMSGNTPFGTESNAR